MSILLIMAIGIVIGFIFFPNKRLKFSEVIQMASIYILIFSMGVTLGKRENFIEELFSLGAISFIFAITSIIFSVILVYFLSSKFLKKDGRGK